MRRKLSDIRIEQILNSTRASMEIEGLTPSKTNDDICRKYLKGEISEIEAKHLILKSMNNKSDVPSI